jgi:hypothetical protein
MRTVLATTAPGLAALLGAALVVPAFAADPPPPGVHKMVIEIGPNRTVRYISVGLSPGEVGALRDLERAENEANYAEDLQDLRRQYVTDELALAPHRRAVQQRLYGVSSVQTGTYDFLTGPAGYGGYSYPYYGYGYGYGAPYFGGYGASFFGSSSVTSYSLANGVGDEGRLKDGIAQAIAAQATPDYSAGASRAYMAALARAGESDNIRTALKLGKGPIMAVGSEQQRQVTLTPKDGKPIEGALVSEDGEWVTVETATGETSVRKADLTKIERKKPK